MNDLCHLFTLYTDPPSLLGEREAKSLVEGLYTEQSRLYEALREESHRVGDIKSQLAGRLEQTDKTKQGTPTHHMDNRQSLYV